MGACRRGPAWTGGGAGPRGRPGPARRPAVEQQQLGVGHQGPRDLHPLALALGQGGEPAPDQVRAAERVQQLDGPGHVGRTRTPPSTGRGSQYEAVSTRSMTFSAGGTCSATARSRCRSGAAGRTRPPRPAARRAPRRSPAWGTASSRRPGAAWSCRRRSGRSGPSARPRAPSSSMSRSSIDLSRRTPTPRNRSTSSDIWSPPFRRGSRRIQTEPTSGTAAGGRLLRARTNHRLRSSAFTTERRENPSVSVIHVQHAGPRTARPGSGPAPPACPGSN